MESVRGRRSRFARWLLGVGGWRVSGDVPPLPKAVLIVAPHTSNWDFIVLVLAKFTLGLRVSFIGKHSLFVGPFGWWLRSMGGIPVDRDAPGGIVDRVVEAFSRADAMYFALAPEGTRKLAAGWRTGFHRIAVAAGVPLVPVIVDATRREVRIGNAIGLSGALEADFAVIRAAFAGACGIRKEFAAPVRPA
jgi:1-acyl-sn-glycerol-3-phosphate acyltransferase